MHSKDSSSLLGYMLQLLFAIYTILGCFLILFHGCTKVFNDNDTLLKKPGRALSGLICT